MIRKICLIIVGVFVTGAAVAKGSAMWIGEHIGGPRHNVMLLLLACAIFTFIPALLAKDNDISKKVIAALED